MNKIQDWVDSKENIDNDITSGANEKDDLARGSDRSISASDNIGDVHSILHSHVSALSELAIQRKKDIATRNCDWGSLFSRENICASSGYSSGLKQESSCDKESSGAHVTRIASARKTFVRRLSKLVGLHGNESLEAYRSDLQSPISTASFVPVTKALRELQLSLKGNDCGHTKYTSIDFFVEKMIETQMMFVHTDGPLK
jgi:hypothetical protein